MGTQSWGVPCAPNFAWAAISMPILRSRLRRSTGVFSRVVRQLIRDSSGQDLIEYGLLLGIIASGFAFLLFSMQEPLGDAFTFWGNGRNNLWIPDDPAAAVP